MVKFGQTGFPNFNDPGDVNLNLGRATETGMISPNIYWHRTAQPDKSGTHLSTDRACGSPRQQVLRPQTEIGKLARQILTNGQRISGRRLPHQQDRQLAE